MNTIILTLIGLVYAAACIFLVLVVLLQSGKGGGLSGMLSGANPITDSFGSSGTEKVLNKWTTAAAVLFFVLALTLTLLGGKMIRSKSLSDDLKASAAPAVSAPVVPDTEGKVADTEKAADTEESAAADTKEPAEKTDKEKSTE
jgi:preprotein translocase subunit SecG